MRTAYSAWGIKRIGFTALLVVTSGAIVLLTFAVISSSKGRSQERKTISAAGARRNRGEYAWGEYSTTLDGRTVAQRHNLALAAAKLNGANLPAGAVFSFAKSLGPSTEEHGFRKANAIRNGELSPEFGGGICQLSSTVYNTALRANLKILERHRHLWRVESVPPGLDAAVFYGNYDLRFVNSSDVPLRLSIQVEGDRLIASLLGSLPNPRRVLITRRYTSVEPQNQIVIPDARLRRGDRSLQRRGMAGCRVIVERTVEFPEGRQHRELVSQDYYPARDRVVLIGIK